MLRLQIHGRIRHRPAYAEERGHLIRTVHALAVGPDDLRGRLPRVYPLLSRIRTADLPAVLRDDFLWVIAQLTKRPPRYRGRPAAWETIVDARVAAMRVATRQKVAQRIVYLSERLRTIAASE
jgi:hypothetical protein